MSESVPAGYTTIDSPITSTKPGEVIENVVITTTGDQPAISITSDDVTIRNILIKSTTGDGIDVYGNNASISNIEVDGPTPTDNSGSRSGGSTGIYSYGVSGLDVSNATFRNTGTGIAAIQSPGTVLTGITGYDMQGPFPGGQLVQFGSSDGSSLTNFAVHNDAGLSHPEDDISVVSSRNTAIAQGVVDGDNSPSGVGVMVEGQSDGTTVSDVDALQMGDGAFSSYSDNVDFTNVRSFSNIAGDQGRGVPLSNGLIFYAEGSNVSFDDASYTDPGDPNNIFVGNGSTQADIAEAPNAVATTPITNVLPWSTVGMRVGVGGTEYVNNAPVTHDDTVSYTGKAGAAQTITDATLPANDTDPDTGDTRTLPSVDGSGAHDGTVSPVNGNAVHAPVENLYSLITGSDSRTPTDGVSSTMQDKAHELSSADSDLTLAGQTTAQTGSISLAANKPDLTSPDVGALSDATPNSSKSAKTSSTMHGFTQDSDQATLFNSADFMTTSSARYAGQTNLQGMADKAARLLHGTGDIASSFDFGDSTDLYADHDNTGAFNAGDGLVTIAGKKEMILPL